MGSKNNRSDQQFLKKNKDLKDMVTVNMSDSDYDKNFGELFQKGNTLDKPDRDEPPPTNLYTTEGIAKTQDLKKKLSQT
jgi:hypothetical protein